MFDALATVPQWFSLAVSVKLSLNLLARVLRSVTVTAPS